MKRFPIALRQVRILASAVIAAMTVVSVVFSPSLDRSLEQLPTLAAGLVLYVVISDLPRPRAGLIWAGRLLGFAAIPLSLLAIVALVPPSVLDRLGDWARVAAPLQNAFNSNVISGTLIQLLPFSVLQLSSYHSRRVLPTMLGIVAATVALGLSAAALLFADTRSAYVAIAFGAAMWAWLALPRRRRWLLGGAILFAASAAGLYLVRPTFLEPLLETYESGLDMRLEIWSRALVVVRDFAITGVGLNCFQPIVLAMYPLFLDPAGTVSHAHNLFLQVAVDLGIPGVVAYVTLVGTSAYSAYSSQRDASASPTCLRWVSVACLVSLTTMLAHGLVDGAAWGNKGAIIPWIVLAMSASLGRSDAAGPLQETS